jgi:homoserine kinase type II
MAVYTDISDGDLTRFMAEYDLGAVLSCKGIAEGVENSNFLIRTEQGNFILTLYEKRVNPRDLPFFIGLMEHLAARGFSCPTPIRGRDGNSLRRLCDRPAAVISFLEGLWPRDILPVHCTGVGDALARLHQAGSDFAMTRPNDLSLEGWPRLIAATKAEADSVAPGLADELAREMAALQHAWPRDLPTGICHADLFPDNVFFRDEQVSGVIDFYFACSDALAYDLAICLNAWCFEADFTWNPEKSRRLIAAYQAIRPLTPAERAALPVLARGSALRFLLTRLYDWLNRAPGALVRPKDPLEYLAKLRFHQAAGGADSYGF